MLDTVERIVWVIDLLSAKGNNYFDNYSFVERFELAHKVVENCIQKNAVLHPTVAINTLNDLFLFIIRQP